MRIQGKDLIFKHANDGVNVSIHPRWKHVINAPYKGEFDPDAPYVAGDIVRVFLDTQYFARDGTLLDDIAPGVWVCVKIVPPDIDPSTITNLPTNMQAEYTRNADTTYYPQYPEPDDDSRFWELIGLMPIEASLCTDGVSQDGYIGWMPKTNTDDTSDD